MTADRAFLVGLEAGYYRLFTPSTKQARAEFPDEFARGYETGVEMRPTSFVPLFAYEHDEIVEAFR